MLFPAHLHRALADGSVTLAFRRWRRPTVKAGGTLRAPTVVLAIDAVEIVPVASITEADARAAGYPSLEALLADLRRPGRGRTGDAAAATATDADPGEETVHRIAFHPAGEDPRIALRADADLTTQEREGLRARLERFDAAAATVLGPNRRWR